MFESTVSWLTQAITHTVTFKKKVSRRGNTHEFFSPVSVYETKDGYAYIAVGNDNGYSYGFPVFLVEECVFDRSRTSHLVNLFAMNAKYATVIELAEALNYVHQLKRMEGRPRP